MRFWDSSGIEPLLVEQEHSERAVRLFQADAELIVWWATRVECASAIARLEREGLIEAAAVSASLDSAATIRRYLGRGAANATIA